MGRLKWNSHGERIYHAGVDRGVLYPSVGPGVPWNGLVSVKEDHSGASSGTIYVDGRPVRDRKTRENFAAVLQAYTYPPEFEEYDGVNGRATAQTRKTFGLAYRTLVGNDEKSTDYNYRIHLIYNALAMPSPMDNQTANDSGLDVTLFSWGISTMPVPIPGALPAAHIIIEGSVAYKDALAAIEDILYGTDTEAPRLPTPAELIDIFEQYAILLIVDHGDGTWTAIGPDDVVSMVDTDTFEIDWPSVVYLDTETYQVSSL